MAKIQISESELRQIIRESVENVLSEMDEGWGDVKRGLRQAGSGLIDTAKNAAGAVGNAVQGGLQKAKGYGQAYGGAALNAVDQLGANATKAMRNARANVGNAARTAGTKVRNAVDAAQAFGRGAMSGGMAGVTGQEKTAAQAGAGDRAQIAARNAELARRNAQATANAQQANASTTQKFGKRASGRIRTANNTFAQANQNLGQAKDKWGNAWK